MPCLLASASEPPPRPTPALLSVLRSWDVNRRPQMGREEGPPGKVAGGADGCKTGAGSLASEKVGPVFDGLSIFSENSHF